ncbi:MAG TPA: acetate--CoA ligase family protein [Terriglobales bacterium]|nr:acetate--CoA ligase family protein [Terriglobales bacterium]
MPSILPPRQEAVFHSGLPALLGALDALFTPRSIAVIGASRRADHVGGAIFLNLLAGDFQGVVYPVNARSPVVHSVQAYPDITAVPAIVDLAIIATPAASVLEVAGACIAQGVRALVVISAGFAECGAAGSSRQDSLRDLCRVAGVPLIGPNCLGLINTDERVKLNATFAPHAPIPGNIGFISQSGALGLAVLEQAQEFGLGLARFASIGNNADISSNDLLELWRDDPAVGVVLLYLESFGNSQRFASIARQVSRRKPILAIKSGRTRAGARACGSHTGALLAANDSTVAALFERAGVVRTDTLEEMFGAAALLAHQPLPAGRRVGIVTNAGGPGILCADACEAEGLTVPVFSASTQAQLATCLLADASRANPVDLVASAPAGHFTRAIEIAGNSGEVDALIAIFVPPMVTSPADAAAAIRSGAQTLDGGLPLLTVLMSKPGPLPELRTATGALPSYSFPEMAARALGHAARYAAWRELPPPQLVAPEESRRARAQQALAGARPDAGGWLSGHDTAELLSGYGLPFVRQRAFGVDESLTVFSESAPAALKAILPGIQHKSDIGAVRLGLLGTETVQKAAAAMQATLERGGLEPAGWLVQEMAPPGVEMILGVIRDPIFGPVVACGLGGFMVELIHDIAVGLAPLDAREAEAMIRRLRCAPLLSGYRGTAPCNISALVEALVNLSWLASQMPEIVELDCNPIVVHPAGAAIVDARIRVQR